MIKRYRIGTAYYLETDRVTVISGERTYLGQSGHVVGITNTLPPWFSVRLDDGRLIAALPEYLERAVPEEEHDRAAAQLLSSPAILFVLGDPNQTIDLAQVETVAHTHFDQVEYVQLPQEYGRLKERLLRKAVPERQAYLLVHWSGLHRADLDVEQGQQAREENHLQAAQFAETAALVALVLCERTGRIPVLISVMLDTTHTCSLSACFPEPA